MHQILIYSDSLTWGIIPNTRKRLNFDERWPGVFENKLIGEGYSVRVIENSLNGRRTVWNDPFKSGRKGLEGLSEAIEINSPVKLVILMLGTNDFQNSHNIDSFQSSRGVQRLIQEIKKSPIEPDMPKPEIMVVCPPKIENPKGNMELKFQDAKDRWQEFNQDLEAVAKEESVHYYDSNNVIQCSNLDGIHLDAKEHKILGKALANKVKEKICL
ncbi:MAG: SGNH/GDSL hydrolase family protein [Cellvibrionales bacterium]|nr:SGNH/GDSL hydrolase family protein [Cellvibrionales bacterium]